MWFLYSNVLAIMLSHISDSWLRMNTFRRWQKRMNTRWLIFRRIMCFTAVWAYTPDILSRLRKCLKNTSLPSLMPLERDGRSSSMMNYMHSGVGIPRTLVSCLKGSDIISDVVSNWYYRTSRFEWRLKPGCTIVWRVIRSKGIDFSHI